MLTTEYVEQLESSLKSQPNNYALHVKLIKNLPKGTARLKSAREEFATRFPLTPTLWTEWIEDEEDDNVRTKLYERALDDYLDVNLYTSYLQHVFRCTNDLNESRQVYNKALQRCALHFTKNALIWAIVIDFEQRLLDRLGEEDEDEEEEVRQETRIRSLYMRWLRVPGTKLDVAMKLYEEFENENADSDEEAMRRIQEARSHLETSKKESVALEKFESQLEDSKSDAQARVVIWNTYLNFEEKKEIVPRMTCLFERAVQDSPLNEELWIRYVRYVFETIRDISRTKILARRALRNVETSGTIWSLLIRAVDMCDDQDVRKTCDEACSKWFRSGAEYLEICMLRMASARRRLVERFGEEDGDQKEEEEGEEEEEKKWKRMTCVQLRSELNARSLSTKGKKAELLERLCSTNTKIETVTKDLSAEIQSVREAYEFSLNLMLRYYPTWHHGILTVLTHLTDAEKLISRLVPTLPIASEPRYLKYWDMCLEDTSNITESGIVNMFLSYIRVEDTMTSHSTIRCRELFHRASKFLKEDLNSAETLFFEWRSFELRRSSRQDYEATCRHIEKQRKVIEKRVLQNNASALKVAKEKNKKNKKKKEKNKKKKEKNKTNKKKRARESDNVVEEHPTKRSKTTKDDGVVVENDDEKKEKVEQHEEEYHPTTVFVRDIPRKLSKNEAETLLRKCLEPCGEISIVQIVMWKHTEKISGKALVMFKEESSVFRAIELDGKEMHDVKLNIIRSKFAAKAKKEKKKVEDKGNALSFVPRLVKRKTPHGMKRKRKIGGKQKKSEEEDKGGDGGSSTHIEKSSGGGGGGGTLSNADFRKFLLK